MTVHELIQQARIDRVEAEILLADILEVERAWLFAHGEDLVAEPALTLLRIMPRRVKTVNLLRTCWAIATFAHCA